MGYIDFKMFLHPERHGYYGTFLMGADDVLMDDYIGTAITISLGTNMYVDDVDRLDNGWWGRDVLGINMGSKLYLLDRSKATGEVIQLAIQYTIESLQWLVDDGHISSITSANVTYIGNYQYQIVVVFTTIDGEVRKHRHIFSLDEGA